MDEVSERPVIVTSAGAVTGRTDDGVHAFLGIPYAAPPVEEQRFLPPAPVEPWAGTKTADRHGPAAPQGVPTPGRMLVDLSVGSGAEVESEDCLTVSIWSPNPSPRADLPVMVWLHGGAFVAGGARVPSYDGSQLAARGVVVVGVNYRLGVLGWLRCEALGATGNQGLADQLAALRWVRDEIAVFGGDPGKVTVFGSSAGAGSIAALLSIPGQLPARRAILQSGSHHLCRSPATADEVCARVAAAAGGDVSVLRHAPLAEVRRIQQEAAPRSAGVLFGPVTDGELVAADPQAALQAGSGSGVDVLVGTNEDEQGFFWARDENYDEVSDQHLTAVVRKVTDRPTDVIASYRTARSERGDPIDNRSLAMAAVSDAVYRAPAMKLAGWQSNHGNTWAYLFDRKSPRFGGLAGAAHTLEVPFVMGTYEDPTVVDFVGDAAEAAPLSEEMMDTWVEFAATGECDWPHYDSSHRTTKRFGSGGVEDDPLGPERRVWD